MNKNLKKLTLFTAVNFVIANMVGTGVFTTQGFNFLEVKCTRESLI